MNLSATIRSSLLASAIFAATGAIALAEDAPAAPPPAPATTTAPAATAVPVPGDQGALPSSRVVATIDGVPITEFDLAAAEPDMQQALAQFPQDAQMAALVKGVIDIRLMAKAAEAAGLDKEPETAHLLAYVHDRALRNAYLTAKLQAAVTDETLKARYAAAVAKFVPQDELHAEHILVNTEEEAKAIIAQLDQGGDFAAIAKEKSTDTGSGAAGGDLGFFGQNAPMAKPFVDAAFALEVGQYTKTPVKSDFGFHVIKVLEKRKSSPPSFEESKDGLSRTMAREIILAEIDKLHAAAKIEIVAPPAAAGEAAPPADAAAPAASSPAPAPAATGAAPAATAPATTAPAP
jgi:peptidyl-prolyl cis-trans isomerase C